MTIYLKRAEIQRAFDKLIELTMTIRYTAVYFIDRKANAVPHIKREEHNKYGKMWERKEYTYKEAEATAMWLNERSAGYPVPASLAHLQEPDHDRNKRSARQDIGRSGRRRKAPR